MAVTMRMQYRIETQKRPGQAQNFDIRSRHSGVKTLAGMYIPIGDTYPGVDLRLVHAKMAPKIKNHFRLTERHDQERGRVHHWSFPLLDKSSRLLS